MNLFERIKNFFTMHDTCRFSQLPHEVQEEAQHVVTGLEIKLDKAERELKLQQKKKQRMKRRKNKKQTVQEQETA